MKIHRTASITESRRMDTPSLREHFVLDNLFEAGAIHLSYTDLDRAITGGISPGDEPITLECTEALRAEYFFERREAGVINISDAPGMVEVDGECHTLLPDECLYIGRGSRVVRFSKTGDTPAHFFLVSYPAHTAHPTCKASAEDANVVQLGSGESANERVIKQYIHESGIQSCQLVMGCTSLQTGSVWNTMPPHTHERRSEIYLYYDLSAENAVFHFMGTPDQTRHLVMRNKECVLSPSWSIHAGCGTSNYKFVWAMGGENQCFDDMDPAPVQSLR